MSDFTWTSPDGVEITIPAMDSISAGVYRRHRNESPSSFVFSVLEELASEEEIAKLDEVKMTDINDLFEKWQKHEGTSVPQS